MTQWLLLRLLLVAFPTTVAESIKGLGPACETSLDSFEEPESGNVLLQMQRHQAAAVSFEDIDPEVRVQALDSKSTAPVKGMGKELAMAVGRDAPLTQDGFRETAAQCCELAMDTFVRRVISDMGMTICDEGGLNGLLPYLVCSHEFLLDNVTSIIIKSGQSVCPWVNYSDELCWGKPLPPECNATNQFNATAHRRRSCAKRTSTTTLPTIDEEDLSVEEDSASTTSRPVITTTKADQLDVCFPSSVALDFYASTVTRNNLGGAGPNLEDPEELRYHGVGNYDGQSLDLVVRTTGEVYRPLNNRNNGLSCGVPKEACTTKGFFGQINLGAGIRKRKGEQVDLRFTIELSGAKTPVQLPGFYMTFADIDQNKGDGDNSKVREVLTVRGYNRVIYDKAQEDISVDATGSVATVKSMKLGHGCDNADDPNGLHVVKCKKRAGKWNVVDQKKRSIMFLFRNVSSFDVTLETVCNRCTDDARNFLFAAKSSLVEWC